jgi:hypothetical protein
MGFQSSSAPSVPFPTSPLGTLPTPRAPFDGWLRAFISICQALEEPLRRQPYQAHNSELFLAFTIVSGFDDCIWAGSPGGYPWLQLHM